MLKKILAVLMALIIALLMIGCGRTIELNLDPSATPTPTPTASKEEKPWEKQWKEGPLFNEKVIEEEQLARVCYLPDGLNEVDDLQLVGYLSDDSATTKRIKQLCEDYVKESFNHHYETYAGKENWWMFDQSLIDEYTKSGRAESLVASYKEKEIVTESKGIVKFVDIVLSSNGLFGYVSFDFKAKETGNSKYTNTATLNEDGTETVPITLHIKMVNNEYKITSELFTINQIPRKDFPSIQ